MAHKSVEDAVEARLRANWTLCPVLTENLETMPPADGSSFLMLQFPVSTVRRHGISDRFYREEGGFRIVISVPMASGVTRMRAWGELLRDIFIDRTFDGVVTQVPSDPFTDDRSDRGPYCIGAIVVPYTFNFTA